MAKKTHKSLSLATTPRGVAALVLVLAFVIATALLGRWQWDRTQGILEAERATKAQRAPIEQVLLTSATDVPADAMGHRVTLLGGSLTSKSRSSTAKAMASPGFGLSLLCNSTVDPQLASYAAGSPRPIPRVPSLKQVPLSSRLSYRPMRTSMRVLSRPPARSRRSETLPEFLGNRCSPGMWCSPQRSRWQPQHRYRFRLRSQRMCRSPCAISSTHCSGGCLAFLPSQFSFGGCGVTTLSTNVMP